MNVLAEFASYEELRKALVAVKDLRDIPFTNLDFITGAPAGYYSRVLGPKPQKRMSINSLIWVLGGLGVKCVLIEDPEALDLVKSRFEKRDKAHLQSVMLANRTHYEITAAHLRRIQPLGGKARALKLTQTQRTRIAKKAAKARWKSHRKEMAKRARQRKATHKARKQG